jgi:hypothetical protein
MNTIEYIFYPLLVLFVWVSSFLWHELFHILSQGKKGMINVDFPSMSASSVIWNVNVFYFSGGVLSGLLFMFFGVVIGFNDLFIGFIFYMIGATNFVYGCFEGLFIRYLSSSSYDFCRFSLYIICLTLFVSIFSIVVLW